MAKFIGSDLQSDNWGEDYLIKKLIEYFDDSFVIYRNRPIFGAQFDVCLLAPKIGIIIFEGMETGHYKGSKERRFDFD